MKTARVIHRVAFSDQAMLLCGLVLESPSVSSPSDDSLDCGSIVGGFVLVIVCPCDVEEIYRECDFYPSGRGINPEMSLVFFVVENDLHSFVFSSVTVDV